MDNDTPPDADFEPGDADRDAPAPGETTGRFRLLGRLRDNGLVRMHLATDILLTFSSDEQLRLREDCNRDDCTACYILAGLVGKQKGQAEELYRKACRGVAYACQ